MSSSKYRADIDGLRAIAVLGVIFFHVGFEAFAGGFVGVDIFFVVSGFLITRLIRDEVAATNAFSFTNFYIRRVRRLFPALFFTLVLCLIFSYLLFSPQHLERFGGALSSTALSVSNFYFWNEGGYFAQSAEFKPLLHTWSLSVEEQFYLVWPVTLVFLLLRGPRWSVPVFLVTSIAFSLLLSEYFIDSTTAIFYLAPFRIFEFAIGALMVWGLRFQPKNSLLLEPLVIAGLTLIVYPMFTYTGFTVFPAWNALMPCIGTAIIVFSGTAKYSGKLLKNPLTVGIGLISYSLYLIYWPIIVFYKYYKSDELTQPEMYAICAVSIVAAALMYRFVEQPFRREAHMPLGLSRGRFALSCALLAVSIFIPSTHIWANSGWSWRVKDYVAFDGSDYGGGEHEFGEHLGNEAVDPELVVYGDSHALQYITALEDLARKEKFSFEVIGHSACISLPNLTNVYLGRIHRSCIDVIEDLRRKIEGRDVTVIIAYRYRKTISDLVGGNAVDYEEGSVFIARLLEGLERLLEEIGSDRRVVIMGNVPASNLKMGYPGCAFRTISNPQCHKKYGIAEGEAVDLRPALKNFADQRPNVWFLDPYSALCDQEFCHVVQGNKLFYSDEAHLSLAGAQKVIDYFSDDLSRIMSR